VHEPRFILTALDVIARHYLHLGYRFGRRAQMI